MYKTLLSSLLPLAAYAVRGKDDGTSREDAFDTWAVNNDGDGIWFHLYHWTETDSLGNKQWKGDLTVNTRDSWRDLAYGWCMEILDTPDEDWDCMRVMVHVDPTGGINKDPT